MGSLCTAIASFAQARANHGRWLVRIDDLDTFRIVSGATTNILKTLEACELTWDDSLLFQSQRLDAYQTALDALEYEGLVYACTCSRKSLSQNTPIGPNGHIYPGFCRQKQIPRSKSHALRIKTDDAIISFEDQLQGTTTLRLFDEDGDFIVKRRDQIFAYQLAATVDDNEQNINEVFRGIDLLSSTPRQIYLQQLLKLPTPAYCHIPILVDEHRVKLSKQTGAKPVTAEEAPKLLFAVLTLLKHQPPKELTLAPPKELLAWLIENWTPLRLQKITTMQLNQTD